MVLDWLSKKEIKGDKSYILVMTQEKMYSWLKILHLFLPFSIHYPKLKYLNTVFRIRYQTLILAILIFIFVESYICV